MCESLLSSSGVDRTSFCSLKAKWSKNNVVLLRKVFKYLSNLTLIINCTYYIVEFVDFIKYWEIQGGKGVKRPSGEIFIFVFDVITCDFKISWWGKFSLQQKMFTH